MRTKKANPQPDYEIGDNYTELVTQAYVQERIDPELERLGFAARSLSGRIECIRDQWPKCFVAVKWHTPEGKERYASLEEFPIDLLDALGTLIPALVSQARRDGVYEHKR